MKGLGTPWGECKAGCCCYRGVLLFSGAECGVWLVVGGHVGMMFSFFVVVVDSSSQGQAESLWLPE